MRERLEGVRVAICILTPVLCCLVVLSLMSPRLTTAQPWLKAAPEMQINSWTFGVQTTPDVAIAPSGTFVVTWSDGAYGPGLDGQDGSDAGVRVQRFDSFGFTIGAEFQINIATLNTQGSPRVRYDAAGNVVFVYTDFSTGLPNVVGRSFDASFVPTSGEFPVAPGQFRFSDLEVQPSGDFVIVYGGGFEDYNIMGRRMQFDGTPVGGEFQVNTATYNTQQQAALAVDGDGKFVVVWSSDDSLLRAYNIKAQRFESDGTKIGIEYQVNTYGTFAQRVPDIDMDDQGNFVVTWFSQKSNPPNNDIHPSAIQAQRFASDGTPIGEEFQVNTTTQAAEYQPSVSVNDDGSFMVVWDTSKTPGDDVDGWGAIATQQFDSDGNPVGVEFGVNTFTPLTQNQSTMAGDGDGRFVVVWSDSGTPGYNLAEQDGSLNGVFGQRFENPIFADGFESGDTTIWSDTTP